MADLQALNDAITQLGTQVNNNLGAAQNVLTAANDVSARAAGVSGPVDYQPQIDAISAQVVILQDAEGRTNQAITVLNAVLPA